MPYVYYDELPEGVEEARVRSEEEFSEMQGALESATNARDELQREYDALVGERDNLAGELDDAKRKFADSFLSSPQKMKRENREDLRSEDAVTSFSQLFRERNPENAN